MIRTEEDLRAVFTDPPGLDVAARRIIVSIEAELHDRVIPAIPVHRAPPRTRRRLAIVAGLALAMTAGAAAVSVTTTHHRPLGGASAEAAALLNQAADAAARAGDPPLKAGQYRYVRTHAWYAYENGDTGDLYLREQLIEEWYAANGTEDIRTTGPIATHFFSRDYERRLRASSPDEFVKHVDWQRGSAADPNPEWVASLPLHDSGALLAAIDKVIGPVETTQKRYDVEFGWLLDFLQSGFVDGNLRAAIYRAAATLPGVYLIDKTANLDARPGVAIGRVESDGVLRDELIFSAPQGEFIGHRQVLVAPNCLRVVDTGEKICLRAPLGTTLESTAVTMSVAAAKPSR
jgi:hypothetical protein